MEFVGVGVGVGVEVEEVGEVLFLGAFGVFGVSCFLGVVGTSYSQSISSILFEPMNLLTSKREKKCTYLISRLEHTYHVRLSFRLRA